MDKLYASYKKPRGVRCGSLLATGGRRGSGKETHDSERATGREQLCGRTSDLLEGAGGESVR